MSPATHDRIRQLRFSGVRPSSIADRLHLSTAEVIRALDAADGAEHPYHAAIPALPVARRLRAVGADRVALVPHGARGAAVVQAVWRADAGQGAGIEGELSGAGEG